MSYSIAIWKQTRCYDCGTKEIKKPHLPLSGWVIVLPYQKKQGVATMRLFKRNKETTSTHDKMSYSIAIWKETKCCDCGTKEI